MKKQIFTLLIFCFYSLSSISQTLDSMNPNTGIHGQQGLTTRITSTNVVMTAISQNGNIWDVYLQQGADTIQIYDYSIHWWIWPGPINVPSNDIADVTFNIGFSKPAGTYDLHLRTSDHACWGCSFQSYTLPAAFTVTPPDGFATGTVYADKNRNGIQDPGENGILNQTVRIMPLNVTANTDASGMFSFALSNGTYTISYVGNSARNYLVSSDSLTYTITINNGNISGLDFGLEDPLISVSPGVTFPGNQLNTILNAHPVFSTSANTWGNVRQATFLGPVNSALALAAITVLDPNRIQIIIPSTQFTTPGVYTLRLSLNTFNNYYFLDSCITVVMPPSYLSGIAFFDANSNAVFDAGDSPVANERFTLSPENGIAFSNASSGIFSFPAFIGNHTLSWSPNGTNLTLTTAPSYTFTNSGTQSGFDFGFRSNLPDYFCDLIYAQPFMRCNQNVTHLFTIINRSNVTAQGTFSLHIPGINHTSSNPPFTSQSGDTLFWNITGLNPLSSQNISVTLMNPGAGSTVVLNAHLEVRDGSGTIQDEDHITNGTGVLCAYDPNDKAVDPPGVDEIMHYTLLSDTLEYLIRFQNTGNDTAFTVFIRDTIDASLDLSSLEILASSHSMTVQVDSNRAATFMFQNILLPDSNVDEPGSHGYILYRIRPAAGLPDPTRVENTAHIYFDLNPAITTNTTWNTLVNMIPTKLKPIVRSQGNVKFYPNPMNREGKFEFLNDRHDKMLVEVFTLAGTKVHSGNTNSDHYLFHKGNLSAGVYFFRISNSVSGKSENGIFEIK
ncbi:MAG: T9SS C-terminal target domain-containing protein [Bacteroidetes bacterium]|nr:MAG: T9SS C-terminal target domain-containing protein [Bacteroidota bacterium]REK00728.1 MAG: T9SS C-terminal target domain-containing protein [Bacteroidota bacterium]REK48227.1 MAG: T9SS C-terminal target domain-containing protein [Bacteroidota bacterium]